MKDIQVFLPLKVFNSDNFHHRFFSKRKPTLKKIDFQIENRKFSIILDQKKVFKRTIVNDVDMALFFNRESFEITCVLPLT